VILWIKARLIQEPLLEGISSQVVAEGLGLPIERAEFALRLMSSLGQFWGSATGSPNGYSSINVNRDEVVAEYLAFTTVSSALVKRRSVVEAVERFNGRRTAQPPEKAKVVRNRAFIVMSMNKADASLDDVHDTIRAVCEEFDIEAVRVDDIEHQERITDLILENIASAEFIIADLSSERPNVYYEVGYAHAIGKRPILVRKEGTPLHFDLVVHNAPEYRNNAHLKLILRGRLENMLGRLGSHDSVRATEVRRT
jgi:nucleoside 2-deoxyribosyltransferase